jgi:hypothetical protein
MAVELQTALEARLGQQIPLTSLTGAATLGAIAARLLKMMDRQEAAHDEIVASIMRHEQDAMSTPADPVHQP